MPESLEEETNDEFFPTLQTFKMVTSSKYGYRMHMLPQISDRLQQYSVGHKVEN